VTGFIDPGFKIYATLCAAADPELSKALQAVKKQARVGWDTWELHPKIADFLVEYPLTDEWLASVEQLGHPDFDLLTDLIPGWEGEESPFSFRTCEDLLKFANLQEFAWPEDHRKIAPSEIPDHPTIRRFSFPTNFYGAGGKGSNDELFDALASRGFEIVSQVDFGETVLER
jgi:hypothetical protein